MDRISVTELSRGHSKGDRFEEICILADIRTNDHARRSIQIYSYGRDKIADLPRSQIKRNFTPEAKRWAALSVPRWLVDNEMLWDFPPAAQGEEAEPTSERRTAEYVVGRQNKYVLRPGQRKSVGAYGGAA